MVDGKTYYYVKDKNNLIHSCHAGITLCGQDASSFFEVLDHEIDEGKMCDDCFKKVASKKPRKKASFTAKAEFVEVEPATGKII